MPEQTISFANRNGERLFGILHLPDHQDNPSVCPLGVICLNTGIQYRTIWHRLNVKIARFLCEQGIPVMRFDTHGIGDSEGELYFPDAKGFEDYHDRIQVGLFVEDTQDAVKYFQENVNPDRLILLGPCGGALTGMISAARTKEVSGLIYMAGPVTITSSELTLEMHPRDAEDTVSSLKRKLLRPMSWFHFLTGQSDYGRFWKAMKVHFRNRWQHDRLFRSSTTAAANSPVNESEKNTQNDSSSESGLVFNTLFFDSFSEFMKRGGKVAFLMPEKDRSSWGFREMFEEKYLLPGHPWENQVTVHYVRNANHIYQELESQQELIDRIGRFVDSFQADPERMVASV